MHLALPCLMLLAAVSVDRAPPAAPPPAPRNETEVLLRGEQQFNRCLRLPADKPIRVTLRPESEITDVIAWISGATCRGFIVASGLQLAGRKVTLFAPAEVTAAEAYRLFLALLETVQLTVEPAGRFLRIVDATKSSRALLPLHRGGEGMDQQLQQEGGFVTRLVRLAHAEVAEVAAVLQGYRTESGSVQAHVPSRTLILTDRAVTVERLVTLIAALDAPGEELRLWIIPARNLTAADLAQLLSDLEGLPTGTIASGVRKSGAPAGPAAAAPAAPGGPRAGVSRLLPDDRAGRLLVVATEESFARLANLAAKLDVPAETRAAKVHAYRCRHADCDAVASILGSLAGISVARGPAAAGARGGVGSTPAAPMPAAQTALAAAPMLFAGEVRVTSDPSTNALLVLSSLDDFRALRRLVEEIDVPRKQVFIEATIMEVVRKKDRQVGVAYHGGSGTANGGALLGGFNAQNSLLLDPDNLGSALVGLSGLAVGAPLASVATALGLSADSVPSLGAFVHLLQQDENVDLVANPSLLITNNQEGEISVGQRVPVAGAFAGAAGAVTSLVPTVSVNREDVALTLKLTPHVNDDGLIRLELDQEMSELGTTGPLGPSTTRRTAHTAVVARDQQTIVIGGLTRERQSDNATKVPLLGDIPVIGFLFRSTQKTVEKQNIILAITPYVINEPADLVRVLEAKLRDRREFIRLYGSAEERRLLEGPLGPRHTPGMLERINRAVKELDEKSLASR